MMSCSHLYQLALIAELSGFSTAKYCFPLHKVQISLARLFQIMSIFCFSKCYSQRLSSIGNFCLTYISLRQLLNGGCDCLIPLFLIHLLTGFLLQGKALSFPSFYLFIDLVMSTWEHGILFSSKSYSFAIIIYFDTWAASYSVRGHPFLLAPVLHGQNCVLAKVLHQSPSPRVTVFGNRPLRR